jgi:formamidopyrimidine-DNA glycosylase
MPELPEVEVTRRRLEPLLVGRTIREVLTTRPSYFFLTPPAQLRRRLQGRRVAGLLRRGKYLLLGLDDDSRVLLHLGMTGQLFTEHANNPRLLYRKAQQVVRGQGDSFVPDLHTHLQFQFEDEGPRVFFRDVRKFGKVRWLPPGEPDPRLDKLGVEALDATGGELHVAAQRRSAAIKLLLLDQSVLTGAGNIYADEALFIAGVHPKRAARRLSLARCETIVAALQGVLHRAIERGGSSISDFVNPDGADGGYQDERKVYDRAGEPCPTCGTAIRRIVLAQRSTHFCPHCQR